MKIFSALLYLCVAASAVNAKMKKRIANRGETAMDGEFPYQVSMQIGGLHSCGGSLISRTHVLTAAHCVQQGVDAQRFPAPVTIEVGSTRIGHGTTYPVKRISYYAGYGKNAPGYISPNDIAMIHLAKPVVTSDKVAIINLPPPNKPPPPMTEVVLSGFGNSAAKRPSSPVLKKMDALVTPFEQCYGYFMANLNVQVTPDKFCAAKGPGYGACQGDSGGPMVDKMRKTVLGVVSAGDAQCSNGQPDTYTDVSKFMSYINSEMNWKDGNVNTNPALDFVTQGGSVPLPPPVRPQQFFATLPQPTQLLPCIPMGPQQNQWSHLRLGPEYSQVPQNPRLRSMAYEQELMPCPPGWQVQQQGNLPAPFPQQTMNPSQLSGPLPGNPPNSLQPWNSQIPQLPNTPQLITLPDPMLLPLLLQKFQMNMNQNYQMPPSQKPHYPWYHQ